MSDVNFIAALDVGTTTIRCQILNSQVQVISHSTAKLNLLYPQPGFVEIDPDELWNTIQTVIKNSIADAGLKPQDIKCLGISTQRATFTTWRKHTGEPFHNFITWKDMRSKELVKSWNNSITFKSFRSATYLLYLLSRNRRYLMASDLKLSTTQCTGRLLWVLENVPYVKEHVTENNVCFATIDTWLLYKLSGGRLYVSDVTSASSTGLFDPFILEWSSWPKQLLGMPHIYPEVVKSDFDFGSTDQVIFGCPIKIKCMMADQQASMFASCYFSQNDLKVTLGTGSFIDLNTKMAPHGSVSGIYPLVGWQFQDKITFLAEAACNDTGSLIQWLLTLGLISNPEETSSLALEVQDSDGVFFIPAFSGLGPPISDDRAASGFFGVKATTRRAHLVRAVLESIVYRIILSYDVLKQERNESFKRICVDGGVSNNDFVCQMLADMTGMRVIRFDTHELSLIGVALVAGINTGIFDLDATKSNFTLSKVKTVFQPRTFAKKFQRDNKLKRWLDVVERYKSWY